MDVPQGPSQTSRRRTTSSRLASCSLVKKRRQHHYHLRLLVQARSSSSAEAPERSTASATRHKLLNLVRPSPPHARQERRSTRQDA